MCQVNVEHYVFDSGPLHIFLLKRAEKNQELEVLASYLVGLVYTWELPDKLIWQENNWGLDLQGTKADAWACLKEGTLLPERCPQTCVQDIQSWRKFDSSARQSQKITSCWERWREPWYEASPFNKSVCLLVLRNKMMTFMATFAQLWHNWLPSQEHFSQV